ncbi:MULTISPECIES: DUF885 family protein [unclassified Duganella]|uniref:DUF885 domain-containing protein n=1 Tax=unclassified Duganella TaxID=2636909 RepID=UPI0008885C21|nr:MULTISPECIES: DUF885 domain-containing protein [unclassified Duganella]SDH13398.1 Uncharacterized conserved protein, DUF885 familyt [Duganella sp. OV458]SDK27981.1 Uncharacterized conserved protein, DUF885 familyt [Duganella sp. OV510]
MTRSLPLLLATVLCAALPAFAQTKVPATPEKMNQLYADYWEDHLRENPIAATFNGDQRYNNRFGAVTSAENRAQSRALAEKYLARSAEFDPAPLPPEDRISYDLLRYRLQQVLDGLRFPSDLVPVDQFSGLHLTLAQLGSGTSAQPFQTVQDYDNWLQRAAAYAPAVDAMMADMRTGIAQGIVMPKALISRVLPQLDNVGTDDLAKSTYMKPVQNFPASFSAADKTRLSDAYGKLVREQLAPANRKLLAFMRDTYLPAGRDTAGIGALPGGQDWYAFLARRSTTTELTPAEIHDIGLREVARIRAQFEEAKVRVGFKGTLKEFFTYLNTAPELRFKTREEIQASYEALRPRVEAKVDQLFARVPKAPFEIRPVEAFREVSAAPASYQRGSVDGKRPGIFYYNAYKPETRTRFTTNAFFLHEAIPGHHFERSLAQETTGLPAFRRFGSSTAFSEGWGLYSEMLGQEIGMYDDPWQWVGRLTAEVWRGVRLVVDTGIHAKGWTREQAIAYFKDNVPQDEVTAVQEVERYIAVPGQALSYKIGELKLRELRSRAEKALGPKFDLRAFHNEVLSHGSVPLDVLDGAVDRWIATQKKG